VGEVFVVNASPVITLAKAGHLALLTDLAETILLPAAVVGEVLAGPESDPARRALEGGWGRRVPVSQSGSQHPLHERGMMPARGPQRDGA
jgi:hypothetical protein